MNFALERCVVFGSGDMGVQGLHALLSLGLKACLVVVDSADATYGKQSLKVCAQIQGIRCITPRDTDYRSRHRFDWSPSKIDSELTKKCEPEWIFSFYDNHSAQGEILRDSGIYHVAKRGGYNVHCSLLPQFPGRNPTIESVLNGATMTGVSLYRVGARIYHENTYQVHVVDSEPVSIFPNETAYTVYGKQVSAAKELLLRAVPSILNGSQVESPLTLPTGNPRYPLAQKERTINWARPTWAVHNLIRAMASPSPGAFTDELPGGRLVVTGSEWTREPGRGGGLRLSWDGEVCWLEGSQYRLRLTQLTCRGEALSSESFRKIFGSGPYRLGRGSAFERAVA